MSSKYEEKDSDGDFEYEEVSLGDDWSLAEGEEDLEATVKAIQDRAEAAAAAAAAPPGPGAPALVDFLRTFLLHMRMTDTLDCFQAEWTEMAQKGMLAGDRLSVVPDVYTENQRLDSELKSAQREGEEYRMAASAAAETLQRVRRARDLRRMQHKRIVQERNRVVEEMRRLQVQCSGYEPAVRRMDEKYRAALKQTVLVSLQRDKAARQAAQQSVPSCGDAGEEGGATPPVIQPRPPRSAKTPRSQTRVQPVKPHVC